MQHRIYLCSRMLISMLGLVLIQPPFQIYAFVSAPTTIISWLLFHNKVGFWRSSMVIFGVLLTVLQALLCVFLERLQWQQFHANAQLDRERFILVSTQTTLHGMLSSFWDASCTCDVDGSILSSTPHLDQLLGWGMPLVGSSLYDFLAKESDTRRLQAFVQTTMSFP